MGQNTFCSEGLTRWFRASSRTSKNSTTIRVWHSSKPKVCAVWLGLIIFQVSSISIERTVNDHQGSQTLVPEFCRISKIGHFYRCRSLSMEWTWLMVGSGPIEVPVTPSSRSEAVPKLLGAQCYYASWWYAGIWVIGHSRVYCNELWDQAKVASNTGKWPEGKSSIGCSHSGHQWVMTCNWRSDFLRNRFSGFQWSINGVAMECAIEVHWRVWRSNHRSTEDLKSSEVLGRIGFNRRPQFHAEWDIWYMYGSYATTWQLAMSW